MNKKVEHFYDKFYDWLLLKGPLVLLGIQLTIFAALVGAIGVAAGLALSGTMQNFASGVLILLLKPFRVSDNIIAQGQKGWLQGVDQCLAASLWFSRCQAHFSGKFIGKSEIFRY